MRDAAVEVLARHGVPALLADRAACARTLAGLEARLGALEERIPWWERAAFFRESADEAQVRSLGAERALALSALEDVTTRGERAMAQASAELPPLAVASRIEQLIARVLADHRIGMGGDGDAAVADELEAIADASAQAWVPGLDPEKLLAALADDVARTHAAAQPVGPPRRDPRLGWAPIAVDELAARAAASLQGAAFAALRAALHREASEHAALAARLAALRESIGTFDVMVGQSLEAHREAHAVEAALPREHGELVAAYESFELAVTEALGAHPPMRIALAAHRAAGVLRAELHAAELVFFPHDGSFSAAPSLRHRALLLAALVDLRAALDAVFPGVGALVAGRGGARDAVDLARAMESALERGPYRERGTTAEEPPSPPPFVGRPDDLDAHLALSFDRLGLSSRRDRALSHAAMLATIGRRRRAAASQVGLVDRLAFWSESAEQGAVAILESRERWHRGFTHALIEDAVAGVRVGSQGVFVLALRDALARAHQVVESLATVSGSSVSRMACPVIRHAEAQSAIDVVSALVGASWGLGGGRGQLAEAVASYLRQAAPGPSPAAALRAPRPLSWGEIVASVGEALRPTSWLELQMRLDRTWASYQQACGAARTAKASITFWDRINVFSTSPAEAVETSASAEAQALYPEVQALFAEHGAMLDAALAVYPPGVAYFALDDVRRRVAAVRGVSRSSTTSRKVGNVMTHHTRYYCDLHGKTEAVGALRAWSRAAASVFGHLPSDGEILARYWARPLIAPPV